MQRTLVIALCSALTACATVSAYLDGTYNSAAFPPLDTPADQVALVMQASAAKPVGVLSSVDDAPIMVNPNGNGDGLWAERVALTPGKHAVLTGWRLPGRYSPDALRCTAEFSAGHQYSIAYDVSIPRRARGWIVDETTGARVADCTAG